MKDRRHSLIKWMGTLTLTALLAGTARAEPFEIADVGADASWVVHVDVEGLKSSRIGDMLLEEMNREDSSAQLDALKVVFNFDPREDLFAATLYGIGASSDRSVAVLRGRFDVERLVTLVRSNPTYEVHRSGSHEMHSWIDENKPNAKRTYAGFDGDGTLVVSESLDRVVAALDVLNGDAASLNPSSALISTIQGSGVSLFIAAANLSDQPDLAPQAAILKKAKAFQLALAAPGEELEGALRLTADSTRTAHQVEQILRGMVAFAELNDADQPDMAAIARTVRITREDNRVECMIRHPLDEVIAFLRREAERKRAEKGP